MKRFIVATVFLVIAATFIGCSKGSTTSQKPASNTNNQADINQSNDGTIADMLLGIWYDDEGNSINFEIDNRVVFYEAGGGQEVNYYTVDNDYIYLYDNKSDIGTIMGLASGTRTRYTLSADQLIIDNENVIFYRTMPENTVDGTDPLGESVSQQEALSYPVYSSSFDLICNTFIATKHEDLAVLLDLNGKDITPEWVVDYNITDIDNLNHPEFNIDSGIYQIETKSDDKFDKGIADTDMNILLEPKYSIGWFVGSRFFSFSGLDATYGRVKADGIFDIENKKILIENNWSINGYIPYIDNEGNERCFFELSDAQGQRFYMDDQGISISNDEVEQIKQQYKDSNNSSSYYGNASDIEQLDFSKIEAVTTNYEAIYSYPYFSNPRNYPTEVFRFWKDDPILGSLWGLIDIEGTVIIDGYDKVELLHEQIYNRGHMVEPMGWLCNKGDTFEIYSLDGKYKHIVEGYKDSRVISSSDWLLSIELDQNKGGQLLYLPTCTKLTETTDYSKVNEIEPFGNAALVNNNTGSKMLVSYSGKVLHENVSLISYSRGSSIAVFKNQNGELGYNECFVWDFKSGKSYDTFRYVSK